MSNCAYVQLGGKKNNKLVNDLFKNVIGKKPVVVLYFAEWCGHCQSLKPTWNNTIDQLKMKKMINPNKVIHDGSLIQFAPKDEIYSYFRILENKMVWVIFNRNNTNKEIDTSRFNELILDKNYGYDVLKKKRIPINNSITVEKKSALILEIE